MAIILYEYGLQGYKSVHWVMLLVSQETCPFFQSILHPLFSDANIAKNKHD